MPFEDGKFHFGINMPWLNRSAGHDIASSPYHLDWGVLQATTSDPDLIDVYFADIAAAGFKVVRFWLFEKLEGLQFSSDFDAERIYPADGSQQYRNEKFNRPQVIGLDPSLLLNVIHIMERAQAHNLEIYWCLLSTAEVNGDEVKPEIHKPEYYGTYRLIHVPNFRTAFLNNALEPFLNEITPFENNVFAIDLCNEPEGLYGWRHFGGTEGNPFKDELKDYIMETASKVHRYGFKCSIGFKESKSIKNNLGFLWDILDFFDFHEYNADGELAAYSDSDYRDKPCIIGEFGWKGDYSGGPDDDDQKEQAESFMENAFHGGYQGCFAWTYNPHCGDHKCLLNAGKHTIVDDSVGLKNFLDDLQRRPEHYWRPVREVIKEFSVKVERHNRGTP